MSGRRFSEKRSALERSADLVFRCSLRLRIKLLRDKNYRHRLSRARIQRLARLGQSEPALPDQLAPAFERAKVPRCRIAEIVAESRPRTLAPAVHVGPLAARGDRMQRLNDQRSAR